MTARMKDCPTCGGLGAVPEDGQSLVDALAEMREDERTRPGWAPFGERTDQASERNREQRERLQRAAG